MIAGVVCCELLSCAACLFDAFFLFCFIRCSLLAACCHHCVLSCDVVVCVLVVAVVDTFGLLCVVVIRVAVVC